MSTWEDLKADYPTRLEITSQELQHTYYSFTEYFVTLHQTERIIFALWDNQILFSYGPGNLWRTFSNQTIDPQDFLRDFTHLDLLSEFNSAKGTALFDGKAVQWSKKYDSWRYLNNHTVDFSKSQHPSADLTPEPDSDEEAEVTAVLEKTESTITAAAARLQQLREPSRTGSPAPTSFSTTREASPLPTRAKPPTQEVTQTATPPVSKAKGKQPVTSGTRATSSSVYPVATTSSATHVSPATPTVASSSRAPAPSQPQRAPSPPARPLTPVFVPAPQPPPGGNPPAPQPPPMAGQGQQALPRPVGSPPEPFDGSAAKAQPFWHALANYYAINEDAYPTVPKRVASALGYFKIGTRAGDWAAKRMEAALAANPRDWGTWDDFRDAFKAQFIPPQLKVEAISRMHGTAMGNRHFNDWYQEWSTYAADANVDEESKMFAFRKNLNQGLNAKLLNVTPQPTTLAALVEKSREIDKNYQVFGGGLQRSRGSFPRRGRGASVQELSIGPDGTTLDIAANNTRGRGRGRGTNRRGRGRLTPEERTRRMKEGLCLYCSKPGHRVDTCPEPSKRKFNTPVRQLETNTENQVPQDDLVDSMDNLQVNFMQTSDIIDMEVDTVQNPF